MNILIRSMGINLIKDSKNKREKNTNKVKLWKKDFSSFELFDLSFAKSLNPPPPHPTPKHSQMCIMIYMIQKWMSRV